MNRSTRIGLLNAVPYAVVMGLFFTWEYGFPAGPLAGIVGGVLVGLAMSWLATKQKPLFQALPPPDLTDQTILYQGPANHFLRFEGRGGWLALTAGKLVFRSHGKNIQNSPLDIPLSEIASVQTSLTLGFIPNGLRIRRTNGRSDYFIVSNRKTWKTEIEKARTKAGQGPTTCD